MLILVRESIATHVISVLNVVTEMCMWSGRHRGVRVHSSLRVTDQPGLGL